MQQPSLLEEDDQSFIPNGYLYFRVKETKLANLKIETRLIFYESDMLTIKDLVEKVKYAYHIQDKQFGQNRILMLELQKIGALPLQISVFEIRNKLHNQKLKVITLRPIIVQSLGYQHECFKLPSFQSSYQFKLPGSQQNKMEFCVQIPQLNEVIYTDFIVTQTAGKAIKIFLQDQSAILKQKLTNIPFEIFCKVCGEKVAENTPLVKLRHFSIEIKFQGMGQPIRIPFMENIKIRIFNGLEKVVGVVNYVDIMKKKVKTILEELKVSDKKGPLGLRLFDKILKPIDFIKKCQSQLATQEKGVFDAYLLEESEIFYSASSSFNIKEFDLSQVAKLKNDEKDRQKKQDLLRQITKKRKIRVQNMDISIHKQPSFIDPILGYTSPLYYHELNKYLRENHIGNLPQASHAQYEYKFSFALVRSLLKLPNHSGIVYRGMRTADTQSKVGEIISFPAFTSTSTNLQKTKSFGSETIYTIQSFSGKDVSRYSYYTTQNEVLFMPHTYFEITSVEQISRQRHISLREIPTPRRSNSNLLFWVDDDPKEGSKIYKQLFIEYPNIQTQIIQILSNQHLKLWINKFGHHFRENRKISLITDMKRQEQMEAGIVTINIMKNFVQNLDIFVYIYNLDKTRQLLVSKGFSVPEEIGLGNNKKKVEEFIKSKVLDQNQLKESPCQLI